MKSFSTEEIDLYVLLRMYSLVMSLCSLDLLQYIEEQQINIELNNTACGFSMVQHQHVSRESEHCQQHLGLLCCLCTALLCLSAVSAFSKFRS